MIYAVIKNEKSKFLGELMYKKVLSTVLLVSMFCFCNGVYADTIKVKLPDNSYYDAAQYIQFDESTTLYNVDKPLQETPKEVLNSGIVKISKGTSINVYMQESIDTAYAEVGQDVSVMVKEDYIVNNSVIIPQGSFIRGKIVKARHAERAGRNGKVTIGFDSLVLPEGETYRINAENVDFDVSSDGSVASTAATVAGTVLVGAALGSVLKSGDSERYGSYRYSSSKDGKDYAEGAAVGAIVAGVAIAGYFLLRKGKDAVIPQYTEIAITLEDNLDIPVSDKY